MFDTKCLDIANEFLEDEPARLRTPANAAFIAQAVQDAIESAIQIVHEAAVPALLDDERLTR